jgi:hypothetical protein
MGFGGAPLVLSMVCCGYIGVEAWEFIDVGAVEPVVTCMLCIAYGEGADADVA